MTDKKDLVRKDLVGKALVQTDRAIADRRNFIKLAGATAAGAGATIVTAGGVAASPAQPAADALYQETAHVKRYYETAR
jgi:hypothetical protein